MFRSLNISYCKLRTLPPRSFVGLTNLEQLTVQTFNNQWSAITLDLDYEAFIGLEKLTRLDLTRNNMFQLPAKLFCPLTTPLSVDLSYNQLTGFQDLGLSSRSPDPCPVPIQELDVSFNQIRAVPEDSLGTAPRLRRIKAKGNLLQALDRSAFQGLQELEIIDISDNDLTALPPDLFLDNPRLKHIDLSNNSIGTIHISIFRYYYYYYYYFYSYY